MRPKHYIVLALSLITYCLFAFKFNNRADFTQVLGCFTLLFAGFAYYYKIANTKQIIAWGIGIAIVARLLLLPSIPWLSDDFYRFMWDGNLLVNGSNPFLQLPTEVELTNISPKVKERWLAFMNSPNYYTIYPPFLQGVFGLAMWPFGKHELGSVAIMRLVIIAFEIGSILLIKSLLQQFKLPAKNVLLYALNPLVIVELTGNLHFEAGMIFFTLLSVYFLVKAHKSNKLGHLLLASVAMALAINIKIIPLIFLPFLIRYLGIKKLAMLSMVIVIVNGLLFLPFYTPELFSNFSKSFTLYFQTFEFNASIYYVVRWLGFKAVGYNIIGVAGKVFSALVFISIMVLALRKKWKLSALPKGFMFALLIYLSLASIVHPWYIIPLVAFAVFTQYRFAMVWSFLVVLSYSAYNITGVNELLYLVALEYMVVAGWFAWELFNCKNWFLEKLVG